MATLLSIEDIHKTFEAGTVNENHVLKGLNLQVEEGDFISVIGGNGAGKSTLMNILAGNLAVDEGDILLDGNSIKHTSVRKRAKDIWPLLDAVVNPGVWAGVFVRKIVNHSAKP